MRQQTRSRIADGLDRTRLLLPVERLREEWLTRHAHERLAGRPDGLPIPPARLRLLVDGRCADADHYLRIGRQMSESIADAAAAAASPVGEMRAVLDFGCGCARVARHFLGSGPELHGCDVNSELVAWCRESMPLLRVLRNEPAPPTPHVSGSFDLIYALSVFSHLGDPLQRAWLAEYRRLLRPGGLLVLSTLGDRLRGRLDPAERRRYDGGEMVVQRPRMSGRNLCTVYHPRPYVTGSLLAEFEQVRRFDLGTPALPILQDAYVARR